MEYVILAKLGFVISVIKNSGALLIGALFVKTGAQYVRDYKDSVEQERGEI